MINAITSHLSDNFGKCECPICFTIGVVLGARQQHLFDIINRTATIPAYAKLYHFTNCEAVLDADALLPHAAIPDHPAVVWFTGRSDFEPLLVARDGLPAFKIVVDCDPKLYSNLYSFADRVSKEEFFGVVLSAMLAGSNPLGWWVSYDKVTNDRWVDAAILHWV